MKREDSGIDITFVAGDTQKAQKAYKTYTQKYGNCPIKSANVIVTLGGDGFMVRAMKEYMDRNIPIYGINKGTAGFLSNEPKVAGLKQRIKKAVSIVMQPLKMRARDRHTRKITEAYAMNEVLAFRHSNQLIRTIIHIDSEQLMDLYADGILVSTPQGSTAYNASAGGIVLPVTANALAVTGVNPYKPRPVRGLVGDDKKVILKVMDPKRRPVEAVVDGKTVVKEVSSLEVTKEKTKAVTLLFDPHHDLERRMLDEQFPRRHEGIIKSHRVR